MLNSTSYLPFTAITLGMWTNPVAMSEFNLVGYRRTGWSPLGATPVQIAKFHQRQRYQILPAYSQNGILQTRRVSEGSRGFSITIVIRGW